MNKSDCKDYRVGPMITDFPNINHLTKTLFAHLKLFRFAALLFTCNGYSE